MTKTHSPKLDFTEHNTHASLPSASNAPISSQTSTQVPTASPSSPITQLETSHSLTCRTPSPPIFKPNIELHVDLVPLPALTQVSVVQTSPVQAVVASPISIALSDAHVSHRIV
ncbi:hypothetical protein M5689_025219 [Euphorbia peplus]|nr:hypothetical protein M5689_025219 [Euphorbia peplus]